MFDRVIQKITLAQFLRHGVVAVVVVVVVVVVRFSKIP